MVVTGDRDAYQLVDDGVVEDHDHLAGITDTRVYDREGVIERYGIRRAHPDFMGLKGDASDNVPGVPGISDETAAAAATGRASRVSSTTSTTSAAPSASRPDRARRGGAHLQALATAKRDIDVALDLQEFDSDDARPLQLRDASGSSSCASRCGGWRRRSDPPMPPLPPPRPSRRSPRGCAPTSRSTLSRGYPPEGGGDHGQGPRDAPDQGSSRRNRPGASGSTSTAPGTSSPARASVLRT